MTLTKPLSSCVSWGSAPSRPHHGMRVGLRAATARCSIAPRARTGNSGWQQPAIPEFNHSRFFEPSVDLCPLCSL